MKHFFSDVRAFRRDPLHFLLERAKETDPGLVKLALGTKPYYLVSDPDLCRTILKYDEKIIDKGALAKKLRPLVGNSFLTFSTKEHKARREVLHHQLARGISQAYVPALSALVLQLAGRLVSEKKFDAHKAMAPLTLNMACVAMFGHEVLSIGDRRAMVEALLLVEDDIADIMFRVLPLSPWALMARNKRRAYAKETMSFIVNRVRQKAADSSVIRSLEELDLNDDQIRDEVLTMLLAGHHSTGTAAAWLLYHLASDPELADAIADEAQSLCGDAGELDPQKLNKGALSLSLVQEVLRLYPSAWWFARETKEAVDIGGHQFKAGTSLIISPWQLHRDPKYWDKPDQFDITRSHAVPSYMPFGAGPRVCVGMGLARLELQILALEFASAYRFTNVEPKKPAWPKASLTLIPPPIELSIEVRQQRKAPELVA